MTLDSCRHALKCIAPKPPEGWEFRLDVFDDLKGPYGDRVRVFGEAWQNSIWAPRGYDTFRTSYRTAERTVDFQGIPLYDKGGIVRVLGLAVDELYEELFPPARKMSPFEKRFANLDFD